jgi:hypothetical protein
MNLSGETANHDSGAEIDQRDALKREISQLLADNVDILEIFHDRGERSRRTIIRVLGGAMKHDSEVRGATLGIVNYAYPDMDGEESTTLSIGEQRFLVYGSIDQLADDHIVGPNEGEDVLARVSEVFNPPSDVRVNWMKAVSTGIALEMMETHANWDWDHEMTGSV